MEYLLSNCFAFAFPFLTLILSVWIPPSFCLPVVVAHQCKPSFLSVPLDSAHLYRSNVLLVLIRPEWVAALGSIQWSNREHHRLTGKTEVYSIKQRCIVSIEDIYLCADMWMCTHVLVCIWSYVCMHAYVCQFLRPMLSLSLLHQITFVYLTHSDLCSKTVWHVFFISIHFFIQSIILLFTEAKKEVQVLPCCFWNNAGLSNNKFTLEVPRDAKH